MHPSVLAFFRSVLLVEDQRGKSFLEVGALNVGGSIRDVVTEPGEYVGLDMREGPGVDVVCKAEEYKPERQFDYVVSAGTLEHCEDWRSVVTRMKELCKTGGHVILTTVSPGWPRHDYPNDYWRWSVAQGLTMFDDFDLVVLRSDPEGPGWFLMARKPSEWAPRYLGSIEAHEVPR